MGGKQKDKKKKGPKGKKARAKAKLDRQWGETEKADDEKTKRIGRSRLLARQRRDNQVVRWNDASLTTTEKASSLPTPGILKKFKKPEKQIGTDELHILSSDEESDEENPTTVKSLLSMIKKSRKGDRAPSTSKMAKFQEENDVVMEHGSESEEEESESETEEDSESENEAQLDGNSDEDSIQQDETKDEKLVDIFHRRFASSPLTVEDMKDPDKRNSRIAVDDDIDLQLTKVIASNHTNDDFLDSTLTRELLLRESQSILSANRKVLQTRWSRFHKKPLSTREASIYPFLARYMDMLVSTGPRKSRTAVHKVYMLHLLNHILTSRARAQRHNRQLKEIEEQKESASDDEKESSMPVETDGDRFRDQGYTRPTVLVLLPTRATCHDFVQDLLKLTGSEFTGPHVERFNVDFGNPVDEDEEDEPIDIQKEKRRKIVLEKKGKDWNELFGDDVNQDDDFKLGVSILPKVAKSKKQDSSSSVQVKLYTDFYKSDLIIASPLGLKLLLTPDENGEADSDYLSSIEICLLQRADVLMMQNWDHVGDVLKCLNLEPQKNNATDFSRVRNYMLEGQGRRWRQLIVSTEIMDPYILSAFNRFAKSVSGSVKMREKTPPEAAALEKIHVPVKQVFQRVPSTTFDKQSDARVNYFVKSILPQILRYKQKHTLIYVPSYFDFVTLRNILLKREIDFVMVHEYSRVSETSRARARFLQGRKPLMLYTGRSNFFHRHEIKGVRHLVFLGLPEHPQFYTDHVNAINTLRDDNTDNLDSAFTSVASCLALFTKFEGHALERVVGTSNCSRMLKSEKSTFMFHS